MQHFIAFSPSCVRLLPPTGRLSRHTEYVPTLRLGFRFMTIVRSMNISVNIAISNPSSIRLLADASFLVQSVIRFRVAEWSSSSVYDQTSALCSSISAVEPLPGYLFFHLFMFFKCLNVFCISNTVSQGLENNKRCSPSVLGWWP